MDSEKLRKLDPVTSLKSQSQANSHLQKFIEFCIKHDLPHDPDLWEVNHIMDDLIDRFLVWMIKEEKNGEPLLLWENYLTGLRTYLEKKIRKDKHLLPFKSDP